MATHDTLAAATDRAIARANAAALEHPQPPAPVIPRFPAGTPEYDAYRARLTAALAEPDAFAFLDCTHEDVTVTPTPTTGPFAETGVTTTTCQAPDCDWTEVG